LIGVESLFDDDAGAGLGSPIAALFGSFSQLAASPNDPTTRTMVLERAGDLARRMASTAESITAQRQDLLLRSQSVATEVTSLASRVAALNPKIAEAEASGGEAADLRDQQGELLRKLSDLIQVRTIQDNTGQTVVLAGGIALVEGGNAASISTDLDASGNMRILATRGAGAPTDIAAKLDGGSLAGLREARDVDLLAAATQLDDLAVDIATAINAQHAAGIGLDGLGGRDLFTFTAPPGSARSLSVSADLQGHPERVAAATDPTALPGDSTNAVALSQLGSSKLAAGGTLTASEAYAALKGDVASRGASAAQDTELRTAMQDQVKAMKDSVSGVSLDEEMVSLTRFQRAYEAATKLIKTVDELLQTLIATK
jgi:flagellar hook-associated protein 1 FlgK